MDATWSTLGTYCRDHDCSKQRLIYQLQNGLLLFRTWPPGHEEEIDFKNDPSITLNVEASEVTGFDLPPIGIEVMPPPDAPPAAESASVASDDAGLRKGYQAARARRALDRLEAAGVKLGEFTVSELRHLAWEQIKSDEPKQTRIDLPSRQTVDRVIRQRLPK